MKKLILIPAFTFLSIKLFAQQADAITGVWQLPSDKGSIRIVESGDGYAGKLTEAQVKIGRVLKLGLPTGWLGIYILRNVSFVKENRWAGTIYNPENQKTYDCKLQFVNDSTLKVRGYKGLPLFGKTMYWKRMQ